MPRKVIGVGGSSGTVTATAGALTSNAVVLGSGTTDLKVSTAFTTNGTTTMTVGVAGGGNGILALAGNTSGTATFTAPTIAGTTSNPILISNQISWPSGAGAITHIQGPSDQNLVINSVTGKGTVLSQNGSNALIISNGAQLQFPGLITSYRGINLVDQGFPFQVGHLDLTAQSAALSATTIYTPLATGRFRISIYEKITTAASVSSVLGGASGTTITYTDGTDSVAQSVVVAMDTAAGAVALTAAGNSTTTLLTGTTYIYALAGVAIQIAIGYTSSGTAMQYAVRATCEAM